MNNILTKWVKRNGALVPLSGRDKLSRDLFIQGLTEGTIVEELISIVDPKQKSDSQLAKVHATIRELAGSAGNTFEEMKWNVKHRAGLFDVTSHDGFKSFSNCSSDELNLAIQACIEIGQFIGCHVN